MIYAATVKGEGVTAGTYLVQPHYTRVDGTDAPEIEALTVNGLTPDTDDIVFCIEGMNDFAQAIQMIFNDNGGAFPLIFASLAQVLVYSIDMQIKGKVKLGDGSKKMVIGDEIKTQLQKVLDQLSQLRTDFSTWTPVPQDGGAALKAVISAGFALKPDASLTDILSNNHKLD
jgi:hypothetical protein